MSYRELGDEFMRISLRAKAARTTDPRERAKIEAQIATIGAQNPFPGVFGGFGF